MLSKRDKFHYIFQLYILSQDYIPGPSGNATFYQRRTRRFINVEYRDVKTICSTLIRRRLANSCQNYFQEKNID